MTPWRFALHWLISIELYFCQIYEKIWMKYFSKLKLCDVWFLSGCHLIFDTLYLDLNKYISLVPIIKSYPIYIDITNKISNLRFKIYLVILVNSTVTFMLYRIFFCLMIMCQIQPCRYQWLSVIFVKEKWNINDDIDIRCCSDSWVVYQTSSTLCCPWISLFSLLPNT